MRRCVNDVGRMQHAMPGAGAVRACMLAGSRLEGVSCTHRVGAAADVQLQVPLVKLQTRAGDTRQLVLGGAALEERQAGRLSLVFWVGVQTTT